MQDITLISTSFVSLGIRSISSYLRDNGYRTRCVFLDQPETKGYDNDTLRDLEQLCSNSELVGISTTQAVQHKTQQVISRLKRPNNFIVVGGYDATLAPERYANADYICRGDGEKVMLDLARRIESMQPPSQGMLPLNPLADLNTLPVEDYDSANHFTIDENGRILPVTGLLEYRNPRGNTKNSLFYVTARGCPYQCTFCEEPNFVKLAGTAKSVRLKNPDKAVADITKIKNMHPAMERVYFMDPEFFSRQMNWFEQFSELYREKINLPFWVFGYPSAINERKLELLCNAGLKELEMGIQSGSERTRIQDYGRSTSNPTIMNAMKLFQKYNVYPWIDIIFDNPYETTEDLLETIKLLVELPKPFKLGSFGLEFLPGTPLAERAGRDGFVDVDTSEKNFHNRKVARGKHIYLNSLIRLMAGKCTATHLGTIPVKRIPALTNPNIVRFMEENQDFAATLDSLMKSYSELVFEH
jgi:anaerobic magnesium-protoporphyrin IX monomethyl ester cyclase